MIRVLLFIAGSLLAAVVWAQDTTISYQGQLMQAGAPFTGDADLTFRLYDQANDGTEVAAAISEVGWPVVDGLFQVSLDFGPVFDGAARFLEVEVDGQVLSPRQAVSAAPVAVYALASAGDSPWQIAGADIYYAGGKVGIGTDTPEGMLDVVTASSAGQPHLRLVEQSSDYSRIRFVNEPDPGRWWTMSARVDDSLPGLDKFNIFHSEQGDVFTVTGRGTVGIRNPNPPTNYALTVNDGVLFRRDSSTGAPQLYLIETEPGDFARLNSFSSGGDRVWAIAARSGDSDPTTGAMNFFNTSHGDLLSIRGDGAVGVGTTEPLARLSVASQSQWNPAVGNGRGDFYIGNGTVGLSVGVALGGGGTGVTRMWTKGGVEHLFLGSADYGTSLSILPGLVGVNNTSPGNTLDVDGGVRIRNLAHAGPDSLGVMVAPSGDLVSAADVTRTYTIAPSALRPEVDGMDFYIGNTARINVGSGGLIAPIELPHGAVITEMRIWYRDNSSADIQFRICRHNFTVGNCTVQNDFSTSGASTDFRQEIITAFLVGSSIVIDTDAGAYSLIVSSTAWDGLNTQAAGVQFVYTGP